MELDEEEAETFWRNYLNCTEGCCRSTE